MWGNLLFTKGCAQVTFANVSIRKETRKVDERDFVGGTKHCTRQTCGSTPKRSGKVHS